MSQTVTCPSCNTTLRSKRVIPSGAGLRCPGCKMSFTAPASAAAPTVSGPAIGTPVLIAAVAALLLGLGGIVAVLVVVLRGAPDRPVPPPTTLVSGETHKETPKETNEDEERKKQDEIEKKKKDLAALEEKLEREKTKLRHNALVFEAEQAMTRKDFAEAVRLYRSALQLLDEESTKVALGKALASEIEAKQAGEKADKRRKEVDALLADARDAMKDKKYPAAIRALESARDLDPDNKQVRDALADARTALEDNQAEKKRLADYQNHLDAGKVALKAEQFVDALREGQAALKLVPDDPEAEKLVKAAQAKLANVADKEKKQNAFDRLMDQARKALAAGRFADATQSVNDALRLFPDDRDAKRLLNDVKTAQVKNKGDSAKVIAQAQAEVQAGNLTEAKRILDNGLQKWPDDAAIEKYLRDVERFLRVYSAPTDQNAAFLDYQQAVALGQLARLRKNWVVAALAYGRALQLNPNDLPVARALRDAQREVDRLERVSGEYTRQMKIASNAMSNGDYAKASAAYKEALRLVPNDQTAAAGLSKARYFRAMAEGNRLLSILYRTPSQEVKDQAIAAFQAASDERGGDREADRKLQQVRAFRIIPTRETPIVPKDKDKFLVPKDKAKDKKTP